MGCFTTILFLVGGVFVMVTMIRWFEQATEAVELSWWNKVFVLLAMPFTVWFFPSRVSAGRPTMPPRHEPVRGFGKLPKGGIADATSAAIPVDAPSATQAPGASAPASDQPPPGTPAEFLVKPQVPPPKPKGARPAVDPDKLAKLKQKMRDQGMLPPDSEGDA
ncbi:MAG TPA: hypothetical protein VGR35_08430 [Tepidisphaeraceae bacterium]|nr:hypothetical protein [Tepidisphaeraceae bacterium]